MAGIPCVGSTYCAGACPDGFSCDLGGCPQPPYVPPGDPTPTDGPIPTQPTENCLTYGSGAGVVIYVYEDTNGNGKWESGERQIPLNEGDPLLGDAYLEYTGGSCDLGDTPCSGSLTQTTSSKHRLVLAQIPCEYNNPSNRCTVVDAIASEVTNVNPPLELSPAYFDPPNWSGWQYTTLRNTSWGSGSCVAPNEDRCLNDQEFKNVVLGAGTTQFWYFNITLRTCTTKSASFELKNLPAGVETRRVSQFLTPHNLRASYGDQYYRQVIAVPIPLKPCIPNCSCATTTCIGDSCGDWCGGQCPGTVPANCNYGAWSPASCSPACGQGPARKQVQTRSCTSICRAISI